MVIILHLARRLKPSTTAQDTRFAVAYAQVSARSFAESRDLRWQLRQFARNFVSALALLQHLRRE
jgi:hypothetical protein